MFFIDLSKTFDKIDSYVLSNRLLCKCNVLFDMYVNNLKRIKRRELLYHHFRCKHRCILNRTIIIQ